MKTLSLLIIVFTLCGCAVVAVKEQASVAPAPRAGEMHTFASAATIQKLMLGISREEAVALIGRTSATGYELKGPGSYKPVTVANPYRSQKITKGKDVFVVDYYLTQVRNPDGIIANDELTPLIFQADKLIGKGWDFFNEKVKK
jgi:hypothetical protein